MCVVESGLLKDWVTTEDMLSTRFFEVVAFIFGYSKTGIIVKVLALGS